MLLSLSRISPSAIGSYKRYSTLLPHTHRYSGLRNFATATATGVKGEDNANEQEWSHPQGFVKHRFEPPDLECADPGQPPWKSLAKVISAEDFANRPRAGPSEEFESLHDARVVLSWLTQSNKDQIYQDYIDMMNDMKKEEGVTSHEYVIHVIAQKYNLQTARIAAIIQLEHNEQRIKSEQPERQLNYDLQKYADDKISQNIKDAYGAYGELPPGKFTEHPYTQLKDTSSRMTPVDDIHDVDTLYGKVKDSERRKTQLKLDNTKFVEDFDETKRNTSMSHDCSKIMNQAKDNANIYGKDRYNNRWRYVAHVIDTKEEKKLLSDWKNGKKIKRKSNLIVATGSDVRAATIAEEKQVAWGKWKIPHNQTEYTVRGVKTAWLEKMENGKHDAWGKVDPLPKTMSSESS